VTFSEPALGPTHDEPRGARFVTGNADIVKAYQIRQGDHRLRLFCSNQSCGCMRWAPTSNSR
jgi:hypothetical protein